jgi:phage shock protein A
MGIFSRTRDIVAANFADLLDKAEDPAKMIRMIILEMEETLVEVRASAARTIADQKEMRRQISRLDKLQESWTEKAELALSKGREDLAKAALVEKQKAADMGDSLRSEIEVLDDALRASETDIAKLQGKLREARTRQNAIQSRLESANQRAQASRELMPGRRSTRPSRASTCSSGGRTMPRAAPTRWRSALRPRRSTRRSPSFAIRKKWMPSSKRSRPA